MKMPTVPIPEKVEEKMKPAMALDLAAKLQDPKEVLARYDVSPEEWAVIKVHPRFKVLYQEAVEFWNSKDNAADRVKSVSTMMVEESLTMLFGMAHDTELHPSARMDALKTLAKMSGTDMAGAVNAAKANHASTAKFQIAINLQPVGDKPAGRVVVDADITDVDMGEPEE